MTHPSRQPAGHLDSLDGLRGVAALLVVISHAANAHMLPAVLGQGLGIAGVMIFFVLSGFLMAYLYLPRQPEPVTLRKYALQRMGRVLPLFYLFVGFAFVFGAAEGALFPEIAGLSGLMQHILFLYGTSILWTVPVEVQFYVLFAVIWVLHSRGVSLKWLALLCFVSLGLAAVLWKRYAIGAVFTLPFWLHWFVLGSFFGATFRSHPQVYARCAQWRGAPVVAWGVALLMTLVSPQVRSALGLPSTIIVFDPFTLVMIVAGFLCCLMNLGPFRYLGLSVLRWLGSISYAIYLTHLPILLTLEHMVAQGTIGTVTAVGLLFALTLAISTLSLRFFERPAQSLFKRYS